MFKVFLEIALECNRDEWVSQMRRMGSCPCQQMGRPITRFHSNPSGKCLFGRSAALQRLSIAGLWTAHCALHPIPKRYLCDPGKIVNTFLGFRISRARRRGAKQARSPPPWRQRPGTSRCNSPGNPQCTKSEQPLHSRHSQTGLGLVKAGFEETSP